MDAVADTGEGRQMDAHEIAAMVHSVNKANGFDPPTWENIPIKLAMTMTEIVEAADAAETHSHSGVAEELADVTIRLLDIMHAVWGVDWQDRGALPQTSFRRYELTEPFECAMFAVLKCISNAVEMWRHDSRGDAKGWLEIALKRNGEVATKLGIDLWQAVVAKSQRNRKRGKWHGKAKGAG